MSDRVYDVVIVGGGPAGLSTALHLVRTRPQLAERVLVLERHRYPRDKYCGGAVAARGMRILERAGVVPDVPTVSIDAASFQASGRLHRIDQPGMGIVVRRAEFDHALSHAIASRGVEVRDGAEVRDVESDLRSARLRLATGEVISCRAVVGADGVCSRVRRSIGLPTGRWRAQVVEVDTERVAADPERGLHFDFIYGDVHGYAWDFPTRVGGRDLVCRGVYRVVSGRAERPHGARERQDDDVTARLGVYLAGKGLNIQTYRVKRFAERGFDASSPIGGRRILLVGEAAGIDIETGEGIAQAIQYGAIAGPYLVRALELDDFGFTDWLDRVRASVAFTGWGAVDPLLRGALS